MADSTCWHGCGATPDSPGPHHLNDCEGYRAPSPPAAPRLVAIVNGQDVEVETNECETLGVLAHRVLAAEGYSWLTVEIRDERGFPLGAREHAVVYAGKRVWISPPIGHGG